MAEEKKEPTKIKCPCCGELTLTQPLDVKSAVLDEYMAAIITGVPFSHTYSLFGGSVRIKVESLDRANSALISDVARRLNEYAADKEEKATHSDIVPYIKELAGVLRLYFGVIAIDMFKDNEPVKTYAPSKIMREHAKNISEAFRETDEKLLESITAAVSVCLSQDVISSVPDAAIRTVVVTHGELYNLLMEAGFDENFWAGIELA